MSIDFKDEGLHPISFTIKPL